MEPSEDGDVRGSMKSVLSFSARMGVLAVCGLTGLGALAMAATNSATDPDRSNREETRAVTLAEAAFPDAPYGVDPVVTGPSAAFADRQRSLSCESAVWPNIPVGCYPE